MKRVDKKDKVIMLLTIIILILVVLLALVIGMKSLSKTTTTNDNNTKKEDKVEIKEETLTSEEKNSIVNKIKEYDNYFISFDGTKNPLEMTNQEKFEFYLKNNYGKFKTGVSSKEIEEYLQKEFGSKITFNPINEYLCEIDNLPLITYDKNNDLYKADYSEHGHDGGSTTSIYNYYVSGVKKKDNKITYTVKVRKMFSNFVNVGVVYKFYGSYTDALNDKNKVFNLFDIYGNTALDGSDEEFRKKLDTQYEKYKGMFKIYTYTFETDSNIENSYLISLMK